LKDVLLVFAVAAIAILANYYLVNDQPAQKPLLRILPKEANSTAKTYFSRLATPSLRLSELD
jgi:hypothetical protein